MLQPPHDVENPSGAWALRDGVPAPLAGGGPAVLLVPAERVLLLAVDLPLPSRRQRIEALPFAVEERIAAAPGASHLALGTPLPDGRHLAGIVAMEVMTEWVAAAGAAGLGDMPLMPDALALPVPDAGWAVAREGGRILVRQADGTGFATTEARFEPLWDTAGRPALTETMLALQPDATLPLDLRQGAFAPAQTDAPIWRRAAMVAGLGIAAHALIAAADVVALDRIAARWRGETAVLVSTIRPGTAADDPALADTATALLPAGAAAPPGAFLPLMARASAALAGAPGATLREVTFQGGALSLTIAGDVPRAAAALSAAGLAPRRSGDVLTLGGA